MATQWRIEVENLAQVLKAIRKVSPETRRELNKELRALAAKVAADAGSRAPRGRTGKLQRSVKPMVQQRAIGIQSSHPAARPFHFGIRHPLFGNRNYWFPQPKNTFMFDAAQRHREEFWREAQKVIIRAAKSVGIDTSVGGGL
jgi:hypothetical protein